MTIATTKATTTSPAATEAPAPATVTTNATTPAGTSPAPAPAVPRVHHPKTVPSVTRTVMRNLDGLTPDEQRRVLAAVGMILGTPNA